MDRRKFLAVAGTTALAGCGGNVEDGSGNATNATTTEQIEAADEGPPYFEQVEIKGPDKATVGEKVGVTVTVANTGGETGTFTTTLKAGLREISVKIPDVKPGTREKTTIGPYYVDEAGTLTFKITDYAVSKSIEFVPAELAVGETLRNSTIETTVSDIQFRDSFFTGSGTDTTLMQAGDGKVYAFAHVETVYRGEDSGSVPTADSYQLAGTGTVVKPSSIDSLPVGEVYAPGYESVPSGNRKVGWIPFTVPKDIISDLTVQLNIGSETVDARWELQSTPKLPNPKITDVSVPETVTLFSDFNATLKVENTGDGSGSAHALVALQGNHDWEHDSVTRVNESLEPGETATVNLNLSPPGTERDSDEMFRVFINGTGESREQTVEVVPPMFSVGETFTTPHGLAVTVQEVQFGDVLKTKAVFGDGFSENRLGENKKWAFVKVSSTNTNTKSQPLAGSSQFDVVSSKLDSEPPIEIPSALATEPAEFRGSVSGTTYNPTSSYAKGESVEGWIVFEVPASLSRDELKIYWDAAALGRPEWNDGRAAAYWEP
ncbi:MAG: hypothetical protein ABEI57_01785 [Halapricum sp.]